MTLYQDVPGDLDLFVRLAKAGHFECTEQFFTEALGGLGNVFAVFTEYVDMLIDQGAFDRAADTVQKILGASVPMAGSNGVAWTSLAGAELIKSDEHISTEAPSLNHRGNQNLAPM
ncbi:hypothetical protein LTR02_017391 [Friedmanniomyces endolithicus]|nr:hypothetical protein LTR02_017391 [Friedmanniomyces endolithicus]